MKKSLQNRTVYQPNRTTRITVVNKPIWDMEAGMIKGYDIDVTIKSIQNLAPTELKFVNDEDIQKFIENIDATEPQLSLGLNTQNKISYINDMRPITKKGKK